MRGSKKVQRRYGRRDRVFGWFALEARSSKVEVKNTSVFTMHFETLVEKHRKHVLLHIL